MKILEQFIESKAGNRVACEDAIFVSEHFVAIIDGATAKGNMRWGNDQVKGGYYAKELLLAALPKMPKDITGEKAIEFLTDSLKEGYGENSALLDNPKEQLNASVSIFSNHRKEVWQYGDSPFLLNGKLYTVDKKIDVVTAEARSAYCQALLAEGMTLAQLTENDLGKIPIQPILEKQAMFANQDGEFGFAVLNGKDFNLNLLIKHTVKTGDHLVLTSDGYPKLFKTLTESEAYLQKILTEDPLFIYQHKVAKGLYKGNVSFDDRSYISFLV